MNQTTIKPMRNSFTGNYPLVPLLCDAQSAQWFGKWHFNCATEYTESIGGPFASQAEAISAALAAGWQLRDGSVDHLVRPA